MNPVSRMATLLLWAGLGLALLAGCRDRAELSESGTDEPSSTSISVVEASPFSKPPGESSSQSDISVVEASRAESSGASGESGGQENEAEIVMNTSQGGRSEWNLVLVSAAHPMNIQTEPQTTRVGGYLVDSRIASALQQMLDDATAAGLRPSVISGYRSTAKQEQLYNQKIQEYVSAGYDRQKAEAEAAKWVAAPGTSEHNTGLAVDIVSADYYSRHSDLVEAFETFEEAVWMKANCAQYGFILRYPKGKEQITGIHYEPWHFRYVGVDAAQAIMAKGITLEEYLGV